MKIVFVPEEVAVQAVPDRYSALISICEPGRIDPKNYKADWWDALKSPPPKFEAWKYKTQVFFCDMDRWNPTVAEEEIRQHYTLFDPPHAKQIIDFLDSLPDGIQYLVIHCAAGISRSAGVAKFAIDYFRSKGHEVTSNLTSTYSLYNKRVFRVLTDTWQNSANVPSAFVDKDSVA